MARAVVEAVGLRDLRQKLDRLEDAQRKDLESRAVARAGKTFEGSINNAPGGADTIVEKAQFKRKGTTVKPGDWIALVGPAEPEGVWLEYGTGIHYTGPIPNSKRSRAIEGPIKPIKYQGRKQAKSYDKYAGRPRALAGGGFGPVHSQQGTQPRPWLRPAIPRFRGKAAQAGQRELRRLLKKAGFR